MIELFFLLPAAVVILGVISVILDRRDRDEKEEGDLYGNLAYCASKGKEDCMKILKYEPRKIVFNCPCGCEFETILC